MREIKDWRTSSYRHRGHSMRSIKIQLILIAFGILSACRSPDSVTIDKVSNGNLQVAIVAHPGAIAAGSDIVVTGLKDGAELKRVRWVTATDYVQDIKDRYLGTLLDDAKIIVCVKYVDPDSAGLIYSSDSGGAVLLQDESSSLCSGFAHH